MPVYRALTHDAGDETTFDSGGYYEQTNNGVVEMATLGGEYIGWKTSDTRQICASKSPHAAALAKAQGVNTETFPIDIHVYEIHAKPDEDLTVTTGGDFALLEEVRFNNPTENPREPIHATRYETVRLPEQAGEDIEHIYLPSNGSIIKPWGDAVKQSIKHAVETGDYPCVSGYTDIERPNMEAYKDPYHYAEQKQAEQRP